MSSTTVLVCNRDDRDEPKHGDAPNRMSVREPPKRKRVRWSLLCGMNYDQWVHPPRRATQGTKKCSTCDRRYPVLHPAFVLRIEGEIISLHGPQITLIERSWYMRIMA